MNRDSLLPLTLRALFRGQSEFIDQSVLFDTHATAFDAVLIFQKWAGLTDRQPLVDFSLCPARHAGQRPPGHSRRKIPAANNQCRWRWRRRQTGITSDRRQSPRVSVGIDTMHPGDRNSRLATANASLTACELIAFRIVILGWRHALISPVMIPPAPQSPQVFAIAVNLARNGAHSMLNAPPLSVTVMPPQKGLENDH